MVEFRMPSLGADMEAGTLVAYRCEPGARVERGGVIAEIETDKGVIEVESYVSGVLERWLVPLGSKVPVGSVLATLRDEQRPAPPLSPERGQSAATPAPTLQPEPRVQPPLSAAGPSDLPAAQDRQPLSAAIDPAALLGRSSQGPLSAGAAPELAAPSMVALSPATVHNPELSAHELRAAALGKPPSTAAPPVPLATATAADARAPVSCTAASRAPAMPQETRATPSARKRARELGLDLHGLSGGAVLTPQDVERVAESARADAASAPLKRRISPAALKRARELGVDLQAIPPGPEPIHVADVERSARAVTAPGVDQDLVTGPRRVISAAMTRAKREIPHYYLQTTVDLAAASSWLDAHNAGHSVRERLLLGVLFLRAVALATSRMPDFNVRWTDAGPQRQPEVHLGVAISLRGGGLISPAISSAQSRSLPDLMNALQDLVARARGGRLRSSELSSGTITVTSLGERGVDAVFPIIHPPQSAMIGFGRSALRPWVANGELCVRPLVQLTLAADHRITDGHAGARYLALIEQLLQEPERL